MIHLQRFSSIKPLRLPNWGGMTPVKAFSSVYEQPLINEQVSITWLSVTSTIKNWKKHMDMAIAHLRIHSIFIFLSVAKLDGIVPLIWFFPVVFELMHKVWFVFVMLVTYFHKSLQVQHILFFHIFGEWCMYYRIWPSIQGLIRVYRV